MLETITERRERIRREHERRNARQTREAFWALKRAEAERAEHMSVGILWQR